jgi:hypothetical protein
VSSGNEGLEILSGQELIRCKYLEAIHKDTTGYDFYGDLHSLPILFSHPMKSELELAAKNRCSKVRVITEITRTDDVRLCQQISDSASSKWCKRKL